MNRQKMATILEELEKELSDTQMDDYHQQKTTALVEQIQYMLAKQDENLTGDEFLVKKLAESLDDFEVKHPSLTAVLGRVSDLLSKSGV